MRFPIPVLTSAALLACACGKPGDSPEVPPHTARARQVAAELARAGRRLDVDDPETCAPCHAEVVREWGESMHSRAFHARDPLYGAMRSLRMEREGPALAERCASCHHPRALDGAERVASAGVSCATCHNLADVQRDAGKHGHEALAAGAPALLRGPHDLAQGSSPAHGTGPRLAALADGRTLCLACHAEEKNAAGIPSCTTGLEMGQDPRSCASCHMPELPLPSGIASPRGTHRSHAFLGPHRAWLQADQSFLAGAVRMAVRIEGDAALVALENLSAHGFPSGFPARMAVVALRGLDATGREVWRNFEKDALSEHPEAVLNKVYRDAQDKPVLAPYAVKLARDSRLAAGETRTLRAVLPAGVMRVEAALKLWLVAPPAAQALGLGDAPETKPVLVVSAAGERAP